MDRFNRVFQKSNENTTCLLYSEMTRLVKLYAANLLNTDSIKKVGEDLKKLCFVEGDQLDKENLRIGTSTWASVAASEEENDMKPFFVAVRGFYINTIKKMIKKFPFGDNLLQDLGIFVSLDQLREEFLDYTLSPADPPTPQEYTAADKTKKIRIGKYWWEVGKIVRLDGQPRFPALCKIVMGLLSIPASNANSERGFSIL